MGCVRSVSVVVCVLTVQPVLCSVQSRSFSSQKGSPVDLDLGPPIDKQAGQNYKAIKKVSNWLPLYNINIVKIDLRGF